MIRTTSHNGRRVRNGNEITQPSGERAIVWWTMEVQRGLPASQKNREENKFSSRVEVRGCGSESFRSRYRALGLSASFSSLFFSLLLFFSLPSTLFPPFNPQRAERCEELGMTSLTRVQ